MTCDHTPVRSSLNVFTASTHIIGLQPDGEGGWLLLGNCHQCRTTLAIAICDCRGRAIKGDIETAPGRCTECLAPSFAHMFDARPDATQDDEVIR